MLYNDTQYKVSLNNQQRFNKLYTICCYTYTSKQLASFSAIWFIISRVNIWSAKQGKQIQTKTSLLPLASASQNQAVREDNALVLHMTLQHNSVIAKNPYT